MDTLTKEKRSWNMSRIRSKNTGPERLVRSLLHSMGYRFRLHSRTLPGSPDIVLPKYKTVIFVHGCYWHCHKNCRYAYIPKTRKEFWRQKFEANIKRDRQARRKLRELGWRPVVIWECKTKNKDKLGEYLSNLFKSEKHKFGESKKNE
ncbi:MAG TPA: DNA mismatch endonuclease Vsr [Syntrophorhabdus sp.]|nr:DNA mismatch endonuclease Vsr [Syntrophorhabdus sp.]